MSAQLTSPARRVPSRVLSIAKEPATGAGSTGAVRCLLVTDIPADQSHILWHMFGRELRVPGRARGMQDALAAFGIDNAGGDTGGDGGAAVRCAKVDSLARINDNMDPGLLAIYDKILASQAAEFVT